jgi:hypothetical protein
MHSLAPEQEDAHADSIAISSFGLSIAIPRDELSSVFLLIVYLAESPPRNEDTSGQRWKELPRLLCRQTPQCSYQISPDLVSVTMAIGGYQLVAVGRDCLIGLIGHSLFWRSSPVFPPAVIA